jgi:hypothetical protein
MGIEVKPRFCLPSHVLCAGLDPPWERAPFFDSHNHPSCQVVNQWTCNHLDDFLILISSKEPVGLAEVLVKESVHSYLE